MKPAAVIDADGHVFEHTIDWEKELPARLKHLAPKNVNVDTGGGRLLMEGKLWPQPGGKGRGSGPPKPGAGIGMRQGGVDPVERIRDMDTEECDISVNYGAVIGVGVSGLENAELAAALAGIYNRWLAGYCRHAPKRLKGVAAVPMQDVSLAIAEAEHAVGKLGMIGVSVPSNVHGKPISDPSFYPFFEAMERLDVPLGIHVGPGVHGVRHAGTERFDNFLIIHPVSHPIEQMLALAGMVNGGVLERFKKLRVAFLESGAGWVPFLMERMDEDYGKLSYLAPYLKGKPSDYMRSGRCFFACEPEEATLPTVMKLVGEDHIVYASDYPHWDCLFPESARTIYKRDDLSQAAKAKVLGENTKRLYRMN
jgi:predicted TIM-barrel fold metal-dependent hydrolase